ncbi:MAG: hypothetical protein PVI23_10940 [Maricaulaceae bacterium]|jgi:hypothetical protein
MSSNGPGIGLTVALIALGLGVLVFAAWRHGRPPDFAKGPRMIPWMMIVLVAATWLLVMVVHLANLFGLETGQRWSGADPATIDLIVRTFA